MGRKIRERESPKQIEGASTQLKLSQTHSLRGGAKYAKESPRNKSITRKLATFVAIANVPNSIVDNEEFQELLAELDDWVCCTRANIKLVLKWIDYLWI